MCSTEEDTIMLPKIKYGFYTTKGKRNENQDSIATIIGNNIYTFAVADGAGGCDYGKETSSITVEAIKSEFEKKESNDFTYVEHLVKRKYEQINSHIYNLEQQMRSRMITTLSMINIIDDYLLISNVGDTKVFQIRNNELNLISQVHNKAWILYKNGEITYEQYKKHKDRNVLTRALGANSTVQLYLKSLKIMKNDFYIICTDGVYNYIDEKEIKDKFFNDIIFTNEKLRKVCFEICEQCLDNNSDDNLSIVAVQI